MICLIFASQTLVVVQSSTPSASLPLQPRFRSMWERYCRGVQAVVFVVDSADMDNMDAAKNELKDLMAKPSLGGQYCACSVIFVDGLDTRAAVLADRHMSPAVAPAHTRWFSPTAFIPAPALYANGCHSSPVSMLVVLLVKPAPGGRRSSPPPLLD